VRALDPALRRRYLELQADASYLVGAQLRSLVRVRQHNLARDPIPPLGEPAFDLITCRNVLIYFERSLVEKAIAAFKRSLRPGGVLVLGAADALHQTAGLHAAHVSLPDAPPGLPVGPAAGAAPDRNSGRQPSAARAGLSRDAGMSREEARFREAGMSREEAPSTDPDLSPGHARSRKQRLLQSAVLREAVLSALPSFSREQRLTAALDAADAGDSEDALDHLGTLLAADPLDADAHYIVGLVKLEAGQPEAAVIALRRAVYTDPCFGLAAFALGRAYDVLGDRRAVRRAYRMALRTLDPHDDRHAWILQQVDIGDIAVACRAWLGGQAGAANGRNV
jgi:tetratricopeptide (TPR) repeat protein